MFILAATFILQPAWKVRAEEEALPDNTAQEGTIEDSGAQEELTEEEKKAAEEEKEKQESYAVTPDTNVLEDWPKGPNVYGASAIVMDMDSKAILYGKRANERHYPASITKLLTTLVALENAQLTDSITFSEDSISFLEYGDASIGMTPGEVLTLNDALYGVLLASANEVSYAVAENVGKKMGGDYSAFIQEMNDRAAEFGCTGSHWVNANGLHDEEHYTTAHDMALIASEVWQREEFQTIMKSLSYTIPKTNLMDEERVVYQNHKMLWPENYYYYTYCTGGKTGYTDQSKTTLVTMADNGKMRLAAVVLYDYGVSAYEDTKAMLDYTFQNFNRIDLNADTTAVSEGEIQSFAENSYVTVPNGVTLADLEKEITVTDETSGTGEAAYFYEGQNVGTVSVTLTEEYMTSLEEEQKGKIDGQEKGTSQEKEKEKSWIFSPVKLLIIVGMAAVLVIAVIVFLTKQRQKRRRKRRGSHHRGRRQR